MEKDKIIMYYGEGCPHCERLKPLIKRVEEDLGINITRKEIWGNEDNKEEFKGLKDKIFSQCGEGELIVPTLYSPITDKLRCGKSKAPYEELINWIKKEAL